MKKILLILVTGAFILLFATSSKPADKSSDETQVIYSAPQTTESLHNAVMGAHDPNVYRQFANAWFKKYTFTIEAPSGWTFNGEPFVNFIQGNKGAFDWNNFWAAKDRVYVIERTPNKIVTVVWAGSNSFQINVGCNATR